MNKQSLNSVVDFVLNSFFKAWVSFNLNLRHLFFLPFYYTTVGFVIHIMPFIDLARIFYGLFDGTFAYQDMCGDLGNPITVDTNPKISAPSESLPPSDKFPCSRPWSLHALWNVSAPEVCSNPTLQQVVVSNDFKTLEGKDLTVNNGKNGVLYVPDKTKGNEFVEMALTGFGLIFSIILLIYGNSGDN